MADYFPTDEKDDKTDSGVSAKDSAEKVRVHEDSDTNNYMAFDDWGESGSSNKWIHPELSFLLPVNSDLAGGPLEMNNPLNDKKTWQNIVTKSIKCLISRSPNEMINYGVESLVAWVFDGEGKKDDPLIGMFEEINSKLDKIIGQLDKIIDQLKKILDAIEVERYRTDIKEASTIRDVIQEEIDLINLRLADAKKIEDEDERARIYKSIIRDIDTITINGNSIYQETKTLANAMTRIDNQSRMCMFQMLGYFVKSCHLLWDHQEVLLYISLISSYMNTYLQAMAFCRLSLLYQIKINENDDEKAKKYIAQYKVLFTGDKDTRLESNLSKVLKAFEEKTGRSDIMENPYYATFRYGDEKAVYVMRDTTFVQDTPSKDISMVSESDLQEIYKERPFLPLPYVFTYVIERFPKVRQSGFYGIIDANAFVFHGNQMIRFANTHNMTYDDFFGKMAGLNISKNSTYKNFREIVQFVSSDSQNIFKLRSAYNNSENKVGRIYLRPNSSGNHYSVEVGPGIRPLIIYSLTKPVSMVSKTF
ncbi:hypothetical protein [Clostridium sp. AM58-1XD]|uniref:hypothetical protein n=1 Tax=Clostridium sp. AM58-1XD TaxID=2292307 RepID=UPI000E531C5D|nr:hypothetical protein [Clostridium sp. AM58-1XD]RGZ01269.1 hypothetical protein DXA13_02720 [Clostridium sp. AM58-1XD]